MKKKEKLNRSLDELEPEMRIQSNASNPTLLNLLDDHSKIGGEEFSKILDTQQIEEIKEDL